MTATLQRSSNLRGNLLRVGLLFFILAALLCATFVVVGRMWPPPEPDQWTGDRKREAALLKEVIGQTLVEVESKYGKPEESYWRGWDKVFFLGWQYPFGIDGAWLAVRLDAEGRVVEAKIMED